MYCCKNCNEPIGSCAANHSTCKNFQVVRLGPLPRFDVSDKAGLSLWPTSLDEDELFSANFDHRPLNEMKGELKCRRYQYFRNKKLNSAEIRDQVLQAWR